MDNVKSYPLIIVIQSYYLADINSTVSSCKKNYLFNCALYSTNQQTKKAPSNLILEAKLTQTQKSKFVFVLL